MVIKITPQELCEILKNQRDLISGLVERSQKNRLHLD